MFEKKMNIDGGITSKSEYPNFDPIDWIKHNPYLNISNSGSNFDKDKSLSIIRDHVKACIDHKTSE